MGFFSKKMTIDKELLEQLIKTAAMKENSAVTCKYEVKNQISGSLWSDGKDWHNHTIQKVIRQNVNRNLFYRD